MPMKKKKPGKPKVSKKAAVKTIYGPLILHALTPKDIDILVSRHKAVFNDTVKQHTSGEKAQSTDHEASAKLFHMVVTLVTLSSRGRVPEDEYVVAGLPHDELLEAARTVERLTLGNSRSRGGGLAAVAKSGLPFTEFLGALATAPAPSSSKH